MTRVADGIIGIPATALSILTAGKFESLNNLAYRSLQAPDLSPLSQVELSPVPLRERAGWQDGVCKQGDCVYLDAVSQEQDQLGA